MAVDTAPTRPVEARERSASRFTGFLRERGLLLLGIAFIIVYCLAPFYWMIVSSLKANPLLDQSLFPTSPTMTNYREVFSSENNLQYALRNSVIVAGTTTILALFIGVFSAYALARLQFRAKKVVLGAVLATAMFPLIALLTPLFRLFTDLGLIDTYAPMIISDISFTLPLAIYVLTSFFSEMPWELEMAAKVDGATPGQAFRKVIVPPAAPRDRTRRHHARGRHQPAPSHWPDPHGAARPSSPPGRWARCPEPGRRPARAGRRAPRLLPTRRSR